MRIRNVGRHMTKVAASLMLGLLTLVSAMLLLGQPTTALAQTYEGAWNPAPITNDGWIYLAPHIKVVVEYEPGDQYMKVTCSRISCDIDHDSKNTGEGFWDGFVITTPPAPSNYNGATYTNGNDTGARARAELEAWTGSHPVIWGAAQSNKNSRSNNIEFGEIISHGSYSFYVDVSGYAPGTSPTILVLGNRRRHDVVEGVTSASTVFVQESFSAASLGMSVKIAPKITSSAGTGGSISPNGVTAVPYEGSQNYTITPSTYYKIKDVKVDGTSVGKVTSRNFTNVMSDHTIHADFEAISGTVKIQKRDRDLKGTSGQGNATLNQTKFDVICVSSPHYATGATVATITTGSNGAGQTTLYGGKFKVKETSASSGYRLTDTSEKSFEISSDGQVIDLTSEANSFQNYVMRGGVTVKKVDQDNKSQADATTPQGDAGNGTPETFSGTQYLVYNRSERDVYISSGLRYESTKTTYKPGDLCLMIVADSSGVATCPADVLPIGTYEIYESKEPTGYLNSGFRKTFSITSDGQMVSYTSDGGWNEQTVMRGGVRIQKVDSDWQGEAARRNKTQGDANESFAGTQYAIYNLSDHYVYVNGTKYAGKDDACEHPILTLTTRADGSIETDDQCLPYGTYKIKEVTSVTGYLIDPAWKSGLTFKIRSNKQMIDYTQSDTWNHDPVIRGGLEVHKYDTDSKTTTPQGDAGTNGTLAGTTYRIRNMSSHAVYIKGDSDEYSPYVPGQNTYESGATCLEIISDENGIASLPEDALPYGTYQIAEVIAPTGYMNSSWGTWMVPENPNDPPEDRTYVQWTFTIREDGKVLVFNDADNSNGLVRNEEPVMRGGVAVKKVDADWLTSDTQGDAADTFEGVEYQIINQSANPVFVDNAWHAPGEVVITITTDQNGVATTGNFCLPYGRYLIKETKAIEGYLIADQWKTGLDFSIGGQGYMQYFGATTYFDPIEEGGKQETAGTYNADPVIRSGVVIHKVDRDTKSPITQGDAKSFAGTRYVITSLSRHKVNVAGEDGSHIDYDYDQRCYYLTAGEDGIARTNVDTLPYGTYSVMELSPAPGYQNSYWKQEFEIRADGEAGVVTFNDDEDGEHPRNEDEVDRGSVTVAKVDAETGKAVPQGDGSLAGAVYTITNRSANGHSVVVGGKVVASGEVAATITSTAGGLATTGSQVLPYGTYDITETKAPDGYENSGWRQTFSIDHNSHDVSFIYDGNKNREPPVRLSEGVIIRKVDAAYKDDGTSGEATLAGAVFSVRNASANAVLYAGQLAAPGELLMRLETDATGSAWIVANSLPMGTYEVVEEFAPTGYTRNATWVGTLTVDRDGKPSATEIICEDPVIRGDLKFRKVVAGTNVPIPGVAFRITSATTGESHVAITDANGLLDTSSAAASRENDNVNRNDTALSYDNISGSYAVDSDAIEAGYGIWFAGRDGGSSTPTNSAGALPYDTYEVEELRCDANRDFELVAPFRFEVRREGYATASETVEDSGRPVATVPGEHGNRVSAYKDAEPAPNSKVKPGDVITYKITVRNTGSATQTWTLVRDPIPEGTDYVEGSASDGGVLAMPDGRGAYVEWKVASLAPREERTLTFKVTVRYDAPQFVANTALVGEMPTDFTPGDPSNPEPTDESDTVFHRTGNADAPAFVRVTKTSDPVPGKQVAWRTDIRYVLHVENTGGTAALMTGVFDRIPYGTELVEVESGDGYYYDLTGGANTQGVGWLVPVLAPGESVDLALAVKVVSREAVKALSNVSNQASWGDLSTLDFPAPPTNDLSNASNIVEHPLYEAPSETSETYKTASPEAETVVHQGDRITYTLTTTNGLVTTKPYVLVRDYVPDKTAYVDGSATDGGVYVSADAEGNATGRPYVEWVLTDVAPREERKVSFAVTVQEEWTSYIRNIAYSQTYQTPVTAGDTSNPEPNMRTNELKHRSPVSIGTEDLFPLVKVVKSADPASGSTVTPGQEMTYTLSVTNDGKATAYDLQVFDAIPEGTTLLAVDSDGGGQVSHTLPSQGAGAGWLIPSLAPGRSIRLTMRVRVDDDADGIGLIRNQAAWSYGNEPDEYADWMEPPLSDEGMDDSSNVVEHRVAASVSSQQGSLVTCYKDADPKPNSPVGVDDEITYKIVARNTGAETQAATLIRDYVPDGTEYVESSATDGGVYVAADADGNETGRAYVEWVIGSLAPLEERRVSFSVEVTDAWRTYVTNVARCSQTPKDTRPGDPANPEPDLPSEAVWHTTDEDRPTPAVVTVVKEGDPAAGATITRDDVVHYVLRVTNSGGSASESVGVYDKVPDGMEVVEGSVSEEFSGTLMVPEEGDPYVAWLVPSLEAGKSVTLSFDVRMKSGMVDDAIRNQATWGESETLPEGPLPSTSDVVEHLVSRSPKPRLTKEFSGSGRATVGDPLDFVLTVANDGDADMVGWSLEDVPPAEMTYVSDDGNGVLRDDGSIFWRVDLAPGEERVIEVRMSATSPAGVSGAKNTALLSDEADAQAAMASAEVIILPTPQQALMQTGVGTVAGVVACASGTLLAYDLVKRRRVRA